MNKVFIIGAGASKGHTNGDFPVINEFFKVANKLNILSDGGKKIKPGYEDLEKYVRENFNLNILKKDINIEEVMTNLEIDIEKSDSYELIILRNKIINIIRETLNKLSKKPFSEDSEYNLFYKTINNNDTILTYNWDLLLDNVLGREIVVPDFSKIFELEKKDNLQYLVMWEKLTGIRDLTWGKTDIPYVNYQSEGYYLKLHGSIDWAYCPNRDCGSYSKVFAVNQLDKKHCCFECGSEVQYLIVPPVLNKDFRNIPFMKKVWNFARNEISMADEIIIWGYSLPPTDFYSKWLFHQVKENLKTVSIINPACFKKVKREGKFKYQRNLQFLNPLIEIFQHKTEKNKLEYYENFKDYYNNIDFYRKYGIDK